MPKIRVPVTDPDSKDTWPFIVIILMLIVGGYVSALRSVASSQEPGRVVLFSALVLLVTALFLVAFATHRWRLTVLVLLGGVIFWIGLLTPDHWLVMALFPGLAGLAVGRYWPELYKCILAVVLCFGFMAVNIAARNSPQEALAWLPVTAFSFLFVFVYVVLFIRQVTVRRQAQKLLEDLEKAHSKLAEHSHQVEELTLIQERERMGRELHDTLAQGLAGLIMQLEAVDHHLETGVTERAREVLRQAMHRARTTHFEARRAIQALRASVLEHSGLVEALDHETQQLTADTGIPCRLAVIGAPPRMPPEKAQHILRIAQESLANVARHARATQVELQVGESNRGLRLVIEDDGKGFDPAQESEGFGLEGMRERAARIGGDLRVLRRASGGTRIELELPRGAS